ncbi:lysine--tRNA ligase [Rhodococcus ruber Chol-4]|uniref:bifunctional lysylphosphatidylglycerol synthetase/lysine--tRNA ligase LysX n=1 Tax=Rhodococcus TaxID=1827 RepID=UPI000475AEDE|nr:bifunctional lysylphosphatidylglycerol synthetase/lysine--tRNA ligase LysX [Rhodococcus ruber]KXF84077.1 lysine--tRNA ligase [Rhodococcus ruber Chol-4]UQB72958.1 bifunctional lysylphosphatidylglycerol synthetase/lysine--tRNA ligase LysX [Rhodococcus ruber]WML62851.1 bifunctional lysylphosphatidylglycerol synthetase/lysine--tRNA ligase LysX [Rhodococcus sp. AH-ZY2]
MSADVAAAPAAHPHLSARPRGRLNSVPHVAGLTLGIFALAVALWSLSPTLRYFVHTPREYVDTYLFDAPDTSLSYALVLGLLAAALASRKRIAWWILTVYLAGFAIYNGYVAVSERDIGAAIGLVVQVAVVGILLAAYPEFYTRVRRGAVWKSLGVLVAGLAVGTLIGWGLVELFPGTLPSDERLLWAVNRVTALSLLDNDQFSGRPHGFVNTLLGLLGALALIAAVIVLFRSQRATNALTGNDESAIRGLLERNGDDSLGYFATRRDKAVVFAPSGKAAVTYRVEVGVCLASGDPIGNPEAWPHAIDEWLALARGYGWAPAVMGASEAGAGAYRRAGLSVLQLGDEAVLHTTGFSLSGREMRPVRQAVTRAHKQGVTVRIRRHRDVPEAEMAQAIRLSDDWRDTETERGFSMALGRLGDPLDGRCVLVEATVHGEVVALLSLVPWGADGVSLDLMRRNPQAPNGVVEMMVSELAAHGGEFGITRISLNFAVFRSVFEEGARIGAGPVLRLWRSVLVFFSRWWQLEALYRSNVKYQPEWVPRFLCFADNRVLPRVGIASAIAEGFLTLPSFGRERSARRHTGTQTSAPPALVETGTLRDDGGAPATLPAPESRTGPRRPEQVRVRMAKLERLEEAGVDPYPVANPPSHTCAATVTAPEGTAVRIAGRILRLRDFGGVLFAVLRDWSGDVQILVDRSRVGGRRFVFDLGDLVEVSGVTGRSRSGELSVLAEDWRLDGKCLHPLPDKWRGLTDPEARVRQRYVDLAINRTARRLLAARSAVVRSLREQLQARGYLEVETPILQPVHGGANAAPFTTHINAYDLDLYLRIAPELYLKRLCVAGMERVFEIGRVFRNEGADFKHNPEFTILEAYEAHANYEVMRVLARELIQAAAVAAHGRAVIVRPGPDGTPVEIDISGEWPVKTFHGAVSDALGTEIDAQTPVEELRRLCDEHEIPYNPEWDAGATAQEMYEHLVESRTEFPTFYTDFPTSVSPLTRPHPTKPLVAAKWDLVAWGIELGTAYSELTDPIDQRARLTEQSLLAAGGDEEAMELDEDFLQALEHAMPPTGGLGMGVDRIVMLITGGSIRESLAFPLAKPRARR